MLVNFCDVCACGEYVCFSIERVRKMRYVSWYYIVSLVVAGVALCGVLRIMCICAVCGCVCSAVSVAYAVASTNISTIYKRLT